ncbi:MAG: inositol-3-phosphate synthase [Ignavibacteria bacterium]|nr:inositol-3-phosphate synthase [Ignavibacteria bacterium]
MLYGEPDYKTVEKFRGLLKKAWDNYFNEAFLGVLPNGDIILFLGESSLLADEKRALARKLDQILIEMQAKIDE